MPSGHRKKPFSSKQKKEQLKSKREKKKFQERDEFGMRVRHRKGKHCKDTESESAGSSDDASVEDTNTEVKLMNPQPHRRDRSTDKHYDPNRYRLHFLRESREEIERRKASAREPYECLGEDELEMDLEDVYIPGSVLDMPKRPPWDYHMSKDKLVAREERYFKSYLENILERYSAEDLSYFEVNLETWRQLWRVLEMADIVLMIADIRFPALHFCPTLYKYVINELKKPLILVINKIDLAPPSLVVAWKQYFLQTFPELHVVCFTSFPKEKSEIEHSQEPGKVLQKRKRKGKISAVGPKQLMMACEKIVEEQVDLNCWREKIEQELAGTEPTIETEVKLEEDHEEYSERHVKYKDGVLTIGCCGYPNVGKSSLINGLMGRKVVSVSKTPGHTKHFQTIYLTPKVKLCDSPGMVFPSLVQKPLQVLAGIYPVAQLREPYTTVGYLAERIPLTSLLKITHPEETDGEKLRRKPRWSAIDICDAWAEKRGFLTAKAGRSDIYRAANSILRLSLDGRIILCTRPPQYTKNRKSWENHPETEEISVLQEIHRKLTQKHDSSEEEVMSQEVTDSDLEPEKDTDDEESEENSTEESNGVQTSNPFAMLGAS